MQLPRKPHIDGLIANLRNWCHESIPSHGRARTRWIVGGPRWVRGGVIPPRDTEGTAMSAVPLEASRTYGRATLTPRGQP